MKPNHNVIADLDASKHSNDVKLLIGCINKYVSKKDLVHDEKVPLSTLSISYSMENYNKSMDVMNVMLQGHKKTTTKDNFCKLLWLSTCHAYSNPYLVLCTNMLSFYALLAIWNALSASCSNASLREILVQTMPTNNFTLYFLY